MHSNLKTTGKRVTLYDRRCAVWGVIGGLLALNLVVVFFTLRPSGLSLTQQKAELTRLSEERDTLRATVAHLDRVKATLAESSKQGKEFEDSKFLPIGTGFSTVMEEVEKLAVSNGVHKGGVSYGIAEVKDHPGISLVEITFVIDGDYSKMVHFVNEMEKSQLFLIVESLSAGRSETRGGVRLAVKLQTYFKGTVAPAVTSSTTMKGTQ